MRMQAIGLTLAFIPCGGAHAQEGFLVPDGFVTRLELSQMPITEQNLYVLGVTDGLLVSGLFQNTERKSRALQDCLLSGNVQGAQLRLTTLKEIQDHPEQLHMSAHAAVYTAVTKICPLK